MLMRVITRKDVPEYVPINFDNSKYLVSVELQDVAEITDKKSGAFVLVPTVVETSRLDTQEYIQSFAEDCGIVNIIKKFALCNDLEIFNERVRPTVPVGEDGKELVQDYSTLPENDEEAIQILQKAKTLYSQLPPELVNNRSFMEFAETCTKEELEAYINTLKGGNKDE